jgi:phosphatidylinositol glycan class H protein
MLTTSPYLTTRNPSPTTIEFTVSTSPPLTLPLRLLILLTHIIRITIGLLVLLLLYTTYQSSSFAAALPSFDHAPSIFSEHYTTYLLTLLLDSWLGQSLHHVSQSIPVAALLPASIIILYPLTLRRSTTESLLVLRGLGLQTTTSSPTYLSTATTRFIPMEKIQDVFVNEAFRGFEVRYLLVVVVEGEGELVVVFPRLLPGRRIVERVWRGVRGCLEPGRMKKNGNGAGIGGGMAREKEAREVDVGG